MNSPTGTFVIEQVVNIIEPNGGVIPPIIIFTIIISPKCTRSIPIVLITGTRRGATIINTAPPSRNIPRKRSITFMIISISHGDPEKFISELVSW